MRIEFWGVRGAYPTPDRDKLRYGGNTNCVVVRSESMPNHYFVLDAGTGMSLFGATLDFATHNQATILLSHLHLQHIIGFQFTPFAFNPNYETLVIGPRVHELSLEEVFDTIMEPNYSPVSGIANLLAKVRFEEVDSQIRQFGDMTVIAKPFEHHPPTFSWGYRLDNRHGSVVYLTDTRLRDDNGALSRAAVQLSSHTKVLIIGADDPDHATANSTTYQDALELAYAAKAGHLILYHHNPSTSDQELDEYLSLLRRENPDLEISIAHEGMVIEL